MLTLVFPPDSVSTAQIMGELATDLQGVGHTVTVITTTPHYNRDPELEARQPLHRWWGRIVQRSTFAGAQVFHTIMPVKTASIVRRLAAWLQFHVLSVVVGVTALRNVDVIITPSPPLTMGVAAWLLGLWHRAPFVYNVQELYPDIAIALGAIKNRRIISVLLALERFVYARARMVTVIGAGMRRRILAKAVPPEKVRLIPNFVDVDHMLALPKDNPFSREHGLARAFVVTYAGNSVWDDLARCESGGNWAINSGNGYYGGLQFSLGTWQQYGGTEFAAYPHQATRDEQIIVAERLRAVRGYAPWPACRAKLGLP